MDRILPFLLENIIASEKDIKQIRKFNDKFKGRVKKAIMIDIEKEGTVEDVEIIPAWKFLLR